MENEEKKVEEPSVEELFKFFTLEQAKQELELFVKEKELNCQISDYNDDEGESASCFLGAKITIGEKLRWVSFKLNIFPTTSTVFPTTIGCFTYQLDQMKMILERISSADIPLYDKCRDILFNVKSSELTMSYYQSDMADCIRLKIDFTCDECGSNTFLSVYKYKYGGWNADDIIAPVLYSRDRRITLLEHIYITGLEDVEDNYMCWHSGHYVHQEYKNPHTGPQIRAIFQPDFFHDVLAPQQVPDFLIRMCKFCPRTGPSTDFAVTAALAEVLQMDGVEVLDAYRFPNFDNYHWYRNLEVMGPIVIATSFIVDGRKFVYHRNINFNEFHIDEIGTGNKLVIKESLTNTNVGKIRSTICRFLGVQL